MSERAVYLDYAATTPVDPRVAEAIDACLGPAGVFGNPASLHAYGRAARERVEHARRQVASLVNASPRQLVFTSGATESNNLAILGTARATRARTGHVLTSRTEHQAVLEPCRRLEQEGFEVTYLRPDLHGRLDPEQVRAALRADTVLVSIMHANNETGVVQPIGAIAAVCHERGVPLHVDAAQSAGKLEIDLARVPVDLLSFTAHKLYGPKGIGALVFAPERRAALQPLQFGGGQERGLRSGTLPVHQIAGFGAACELCVQLRTGEVARIEALRERLWRGLGMLDGVLDNGHPTERIAHILNLSFEGVEGESLLLGLPELAVSTGSACHSDSDEPSYVLMALGRSAELAQSSLRLSLGRYSSEQDVDVAIGAITREVRRLRRVAP